MRTLTTFVLAIGFGVALAANAADCAQTHRAPAPRAHHYHIRTATMYYSFFAPTPPPLPGPRRR